jgi:ABC-type branched-chain amino acid transport systems, periplasmic component
MVKRGSWQKRLGLLLMPLIVGSFVAGCGGESSDSDVIKVGANLEITGGSANYGLSGSNGAKLAVEEFNANGGFKGKKVELIVVDNKSEAAESAVAMQKLIGEGVVATVASNLSSNAIASAQICEDGKVPSVSPMGTNPRVTIDEKGNVRPYSFRATFIDPFQGSVMAEFASKSLNAKKVAIYIDNSSDYSKGLAQFFEEGFVAAGGEVVSKEAYLQKDTDFRATLTKIRAMNPDVIFVPGYYQEVGLIIKQARDMGITVPMIGGDGWDSENLISLAGDVKNLEGCYFSSMFSPDDTDPKAVAFTEAYKKAYGKAPDAFAALGYDAMGMILNAMVQADSADSEKIRDALEKTKDFQGASGKITLNENHDPVKSAIIISFVDGKQTFKERIDP